MKRLWVTLLFALGLAGCVPAPPKPPAPPPTRVVRATLTNGHDFVTDATVTLDVDPPYLAQPPCTNNGGVVDCPLNPGVPAPFGAHWHVRADGYKPIDLDFVLNPKADFLGAGNVGFQMVPAQNEPPDEGHARLTFLELDTPTAPPMPLIPSKRELLTAQHTFQGLFVHCDEFGPALIPVFDIMIDTVSPTCVDEILKVHRDANDKIVSVAVSHAYFEAGIRVPISSGHDWTYDLPGLHGFLLHIIREGFYVQLHLAGDGTSVFKDGAWRYNDPVGWTYGYEFLKEFFPKLADSLDDLHGYIRFVNGFDGVFYGWSPEEAVAFSKEFKQRFPDGTLGIEFNVGHIPFGEGGSDYLANGRMSLYDLLLGEFPRPLTGDDVWQIIGRLVPNYRRPADQPANDDPSPPFYLRVWPGIFNCWEWGIYDFVRDRASAAAIALERTQLRTMGCQFVG